MFRTTLIDSMSTSADGFINDREGAFEWGAPGEELFRFHTAKVGELGGYLLGRRLYEAMLVWDGSVDARERAPGRVRRHLVAIPKVVFSRTLDSVQGNARLAEASVAEEIAAALDATDKAVSDRRRRAWPRRLFELGLVDELRMFRYPVVVGGGTPFLPPVTDDIALDLMETRTFESRVIYERYGRR